MKVIETNLTSKINGEVLDHQSRVVEVDSWESYVLEYKENKKICRKSALGSLPGYTISRSGEVTNFIHDNFHLHCDIITGKHDSSTTIKKLAYLIDSEEGN